MTWSAADGKRKTDGSWSVSDGGPSLSLEVYESFQTRTLEDQSFYLTLVLGKLFIHIFWHNLSYVICSILTSETEF